MIYIKEQVPKKLSGLSSLEVSFDYKPEIVSVIKSIGNCIYDKNSKSWEVPSNKLSILVNSLHDYDDVSISTLDYKENSQIKYDLIDYKVKPFNHQIDAIQYGLNHDKWLLLDAPGLGKTLTMICLAEELKKRDNIEHCLIICGKNILKTNWKKEIQKFSSLSSHILGERLNKKGSTVIGSVSDRANELKTKLEDFFIVTNIETIRSDDVVKNILNGPNKFDMIVFDEIHTCKDPSSQQGKHVLKLNKAKYRIGLTGTLIMNNPIDSFMPLKWIGVEHSNYTNFKYYYCNFAGPFNNILVGFKNMQVLKDELDSCSLRRTKDLLDLPEKNIIEEYIDMQDDQLMFYRNVVEGIRDQVDRVTLNTTSLLSLVVRLRQATACPSILTSENISSAKIDRAVDLANEIIENGNKVVIFSTFKETVNMLNIRLKNYKPLICTGDVNQSVIDNNINMFQNNDSCKLLIATWQKMGTGITLNSASYAIFIDMPWTAAETEQVEDRIHRIGSKRPVFIYRLICSNTIDERVLELNKDKEAMGDYIVDDKITESSIDSLRKYIEEL